MHVLGKLLYFLKVVQWNLYNVDTISVLSKEVFLLWRLPAGIFPVGVAMHSRAVECYEGTFQLLKSYYKVQLLNQSCVRGMRASALLSKFYTVQVLVRPNNLSTVRNSEVSAFGSFLWEYLMPFQLGPCQVAT